MEAAREQRLFPQSRDEQNDTDCDQAHAAHDNPCGHRSLWPLPRVASQRAPARVERRAASPWLAVSRGTRLRLVILGQTFVVTSPEFEGWLTLPADVALALPLEFDAEASGIIRVVKN